VQAKFRNVAQGVSSFRKTVHNEVMTTATTAAWLEPHTALALCKNWLHREGYGTPSAGVVYDMLLSLANYDDVDLSRLRLLDEERRHWFASIIAGLHVVGDKDLVKGLLAEAA
jgi:hypothetical protein